jgi:hypothetical protein
MKSILLVLLLTTGETIIIPETLEIGEFCSDKIEVHTKFIENSKYCDGCNEPWIFRYYHTKNDHDEVMQIVVSSWCESIDRKHYINYNIGEPCEVQK